MTTGHAEKLFCKIPTEVEKWRPYRPPTAWTRGKAATALQSVDEIDIGLYNSFLMRVLLTYFHVSNDVFRLSKFALLS